MVNGDLRKLIRRITFSGDKKHLYIEWSHLDISYRQRIKDALIKDFGSANVFEDFDFEAMDEATRQEFNKYYGKYFKKQPTK